MFESTNIYLSINYKKMKRITLLSAALIFTGGLVFGQSAKFSTSALVDVKPMVVTLTNIEVETEGNWKTIALNDFIKANNIHDNDVVNGFEISFVKTGAKDRVIYDDLLRLMIPGTESTDDLVGVNQALNQPWASQYERVSIGGMENLMGLPAITFGDLKNRGLYLEYKVDGVDAFNLAELSLTIYGQQKAEKKPVGTFR